MYPVDSNNFPVKSRGRLSSTRSLQLLVAVSYRSLLLFAVFSSILDWEILTLVIPPRFAAFPIPGFVFVEKSLSAFARFLQFCDRCCPSSRLALRFAGAEKWETARPRMVGCLNRRETDGQGFATCFNRYNFTSVDGAVFQRAILGNCSSTNGRLFQPSGN